MTSDPESQIRVARQCLRRLILPIPFGDEDGAVEEFSRAIPKIGIEFDDLADFLGLRVREWEINGIPSDDFKILIDSALSGLSCEGAPEIRARYFDLHRVALDDPAGLSHLQARQLLSHLPLMTILCSTERMSASQILRVLRARDARVKCSWVAIRRMLETLGIYRGLELPLFKDLFSCDSANEEEFFADSPFEECLEAVAAVGSGLGLVELTIEHLKTLLPLDQSPLYSTLEMLHYQLMIAEFYDHSLTFTYEHKPRGGAMNWLHDQYPDSIKAGKQPFLNIAKSLYRISEDWALARDRPTEALAMTKLLEDIESLGFPAKREISEKLRWLIQRYLKRFSGEAVFIPKDLPLDRIRGAAQSVASSPSKTFGILEQRLTDAMAAAIHSVETGWHASAIGQSVFATNRSSKKFGDCEFANHGENLITAYESHGGRATRWYLDDHISTLHKTVSARRHSLEENFDLSMLRVKVVFVAHAFEVSEREAPSNLEIDGIRFEFAKSTFLEMLGDAEGKGLDEALRQHFAHALNNNKRTTTPQTIRNRFLELAVVRQS